MSTHNVYFRGEIRQILCGYSLLSVAMLYLYKHFTFFCHETMFNDLFIEILPQHQIRVVGVVGWCEGAVYLTSPGRQLILAYSWARPAILVVGKGRGGMFLFLLFLHFHSCSSFFPVPLFHLLYSLFSPTLSSISFLPFFGRRHKMTLKG